MATHTHSTTKLERRHLRDWWTPERRIRLILPFVVVVRVVAGMARTIRADWTAARARRREVIGLSRIIRRFWPQIWEQRLILSGAFVTLLAQIVFRLLEPWPLKFVFDRIIVPAGTAPATGIVWLDQLSQPSLLALAALSVVVIAALQGGAAYLNKVGFALASSRVLTDVRAMLYRHLQRLSLSFHSKARSGDLISRITGDVAVLQDVTVTAALPLVVNIATLIGMLGLMLWLNWSLALLAFATFPLFVLTMYRLSTRIRQIARKERKREGELASSAAQTFGAIKVVQALSLEGTLEREFAEQNEQSLVSGVKGKRLAALLERSVDMVIAVGYAGVLWYGASLVLRGRLTPGDLLVFLTYLKNAYRPVRDLAKYTGRIAKATAAGERVVTLLDTAPEIDDRPDAVEAPVLRGAVRFENVSFGYEPNHPVLRDLDLAVEPGQRIALVGGSGGGKSTLASLLPRLYDPTAGRVLIDGRDIRTYTLQSLRRQIAIVLQESVLFAVSVRDNIAYGAPGVTDREIEAAARLANAHDFIMRLPDGYDTILGERGATLSGGQRQRIAIARAAVRNAPIVILDEPTTGLDNESAQAVNEALDRLTADRTTFVIAHDLRTIERADLILYMEQGRVIERGTHAGLITLGGRYAALHAIQSSREDVPHHAEATDALAR
jgi:ATP-binding cassette, subfamily B, bacterial